MTVRRYLISSPPRSGGNLVQAILHSCHVPVVHTHDPRCELDCYKSTALIILRRRDVFAAAMSNCLVWATGQSTEYPISRFDPVEISKTDFLAQVAVQVTYRDSHDFARSYGAVYDFDFEDFVNAHDVITSRLGLKQDPTLLDLKQLNNPAPYNFRQIVKNYQDLYGIFRDLSWESLQNPFAGSYGKERANYG